MHPSPSNPSLIVNHHPIADVILIFKDTYGFTTGPLNTTNYDIWSPAKKTALCSNLEVKVRSSGRAENGMLALQYGTSKGFSGIIFTTPNAYLCTKFRT